VCTNRLLFGEWPGDEDMKMHDFTFEHVTWKFNDIMHLVSSITCQSSYQLLLVVAMHLSSSNYCV